MLSEDAFQYSILAYLRSLCCPAPGGLHYWLSAREEHFPPGGPQEGLSGWTRYF